MKQMQLNQSKLLGFRIQPKGVGGGVGALGSQVGQSKVGFKPQPF